MRLSQFYLLSMCLLVLLPAGSAQAYLDLPVFGRNDIPIYVTPVLTQEQKNEQRKLQLQMLYGIQKYNSCSRSCTDSGAPFLAAMCLGQIEGCLKYAQTSPAPTPPYSAPSCPSGYVPQNGSCVTPDQGCQNKNGSFFAWSGKIVNGQYECVCKQGFTFDVVKNACVLTLCPLGQGWDGTRCIPSTIIPTPSVIPQLPSAPEENEAPRARTMAEAWVDAQNSAPLLSETSAHLTTDGQAFGVALNMVDTNRLGRFIEDGSDVATRALGSGERRALIRDAFDTMGGVPTSVDIERLANGQIPLTRNLAREQEQLPQTRATFRLIYGRDPNFQSHEENLAWNALMYRIRFSRDLAREQRGITEYRRLFHQAPSTPFHWATVRVLGYAR